MRFGLRLRHRRDEGADVPTNVRILTLILHLERGVIGGTALASRGAGIPGRTTRASILSRSSGVTFPGRLTDMGDPEWQESP